MEGYVYAQVIVEGPTDIPVVTALMRAAGWNDNQFKVMSANGKGAIDRGIKKYWEAARVLPYVIFRDLDQDAEGCPVTLRAQLVDHTPGESPGMPLPADQPLPGSCCEERTKPVISGHAPTQ